MLLGWGEIGDLGVFSSKDEMKQQMKKEYGDSSSYKNSAHATWQFVHDIKIGDVVYVKKVIMEFLAKELLSLIMNMMQIAQMNILMLEK